MFRHAAYVVRQSIRHALGRTWMRLHGASVPRSCSVDGFPMLPMLRGALRLGERVTLQSRRSSYAMGASFPSVMFTTEPGASIVVEENTYIAFSVLYATRSISIGKRVLIASGCRVSDNDGHFVDRIPRTGSPNMAGEPVVIEDDVWLACGVTVCKGVTIGKGSVIGTQSVVTHDIPPGVFAAGSPARVIRPLRLEDKA